MTIFVLGVLVGLLIGAFLWTHLAVIRAEADFAKRLRIARRAWERDAAVVVDGRLIELAPTHPVFDKPHMRVR